MHMGPHVDTADTLVRPERFLRTLVFVKAPTKGQDRWYVLQLQKRISLYAVRPSAFVSLFRTYYNEMLRRGREPLVMCVSLMVNFGQ